MTTAEGISWLERLTERAPRSFNLAQVIAQRAFWEAWCLGQASGLIEALAPMLGQEQARQEVLALPHVKAWRHGRPRLIWTGFEPFGGHDVNPSGPISTLAAQRPHPQGWQVDAQRLPVTYAQAAQFAESVDHDPSAPLVLIHLGLAAQRQEICFEEFGHNVSGGTPDNEGDEGLSTYRLTLGGPIARQSAMPVNAMLRRWRQLDGAPAARISRDAGDYICNAILYHSLGALEQRPGQGTALFIHLPALPAASYEAVASALSVVVGAVIESLGVA